MRWTTTIWTMILLHTSVAAVSQITLQEKNAPLQTVLAHIEKQTKYVFLYEPDQLRLPPFNISIKNATLEQTLEKCFRGQPVEFSILGNNVLLKGRAVPPAATPRRMLVKWKGLRRSRPSHGRGYRI
ncbi:STN domain-containing protein [Puia sp. P3]|uniref:STN domain-containing protein n=1 Tax=Puia sp. P3 TaxID=3423952 RepID=UPI003D67770E